MAKTENSEVPIRHGYASVNSIRLHYVEAGSGDNLVILLHGFPEFWYSWRKQLDALSGSFHLVAPDLRGYNLSDKPPRVEDYKIDELVADVIGLIDHFGAKEAAIVGHDWGAGVAWALAQQHPERLSKLAVLQVPYQSAEFSRNRAYLHRKGRQEVYVYNGRSRAVQRGSPTARRAHRSH